MYRLEIEHNAEAAHRFLQTQCSPKCRSIHGHSWRIILTLRAEKLNEEGMVIEFGQLKAAWRSWLDTNLDHSLMLHHADPMVQAVRSIHPETRLFLMAEDPTTEHIARLLYQQAEVVLQALNCDHAVHVERVRLEETRVNSAEYVADDL